MPRERMTEPQSVRVRAPAKINLFLRILAREESGYHQLETLYSAIDFWDELVLDRTESAVTVEVDGADIGPPEENLALRAARSFLDESGSVDGVRIRLSKTIPAGAGLGGGSSDAGATLRAMNLMFGNPFSEAELLDLAAPLGADVPFFASGRGTALAWGRGERLIGLPAVPQGVVLLALPPLAVSTADAYQGLAVPDRVVATARGLEAFGDLARLAEMAENDFERPVFARHPELGRLRADMEQEGAMTARLSGSGAALFGLFADEDGAETARATLSASWKDTTFVTTRMLASQPDPEANP